MGDNFRRNTNYPPAFGGSNSFGNNNFNNNFNTNNNNHFTGNGGNSFRGNTPGGNIPGGNTPSGNTPGGNSSGGNTPGGSHFPPVFRPNGGPNELNRFPPRFQNNERSNDNRNFVRPREPREQVNSEFIDPIRPPIRNAMPMGIRLCGQGNTGSNTSTGMGPPFSSPGFRGRNPSMSGVFRGRGGFGSSSFAEKRVVKATSPNIQRDNRPMWPSRGVSTSKDGDEDDVEPNSSTKAVYETPKTDREKPLMFVKDEEDWSYDETTYTSFTSKDKPSTSKDKDSLGIKDRFNNLVNGMISFSSKIAGQKTEEDILPGLGQEESIPKKAIPWAAEESREIEDEEEFLYSDSKDVTDTETKRGDGDFMNELKAYQREQWNRQEKQGKRFTGNERQKVKDKDMKDNFENVEESNKDDGDEASLSGTDTLPAVDTEEEEIEKEKELQKSETQRDEDAKDKDENNKDEKIKDEKIRDEKIKDEKSKDERNKDERSKDEKSKDEKSKDERSKDERSKDEKSKDEKSKDEKNKDEKNKDEKNRDEKNRDEKNRDEKNKVEKSKEEKNKDEKDKDEKDKYEKDKIEKENSKKAWEAEWKAKLEALKKEKEKGKAKKKKETNLPEVNKDETEVSKKSEQAAGRKRKIEELDGPKDDKSRDSGPESKPKPEKKLRSRSNSGSKPEEETGKDVPPLDGKRTTADLAKECKTKKASTEKEKAGDPAKPLIGEITAEREKSCEREKSVENGSVEENKKTKTEERTLKKGEVLELEENKKEKLKQKTREMLRTLMKHGSIVYQPLCTCKVPGTTFTVIQQPLCCQALDTIDEKLVPCNGKVSGSELIRPATRIPFMALCDLHRIRMTHHQCCPQCGLFCSQGKFLQCRKEAKWKHWFHQKCFNMDRVGDPLCPHCGEKSEQHEIQLRLKLLEATKCEEILGDSGDRIVKEVGTTSSTPTASNKLVPTAHPPKRAKMSFDTSKYLSKTKELRALSEEKEKFSFDPALTVNIKKADGGEIKFRHMPLGLPKDLMINISSALDKKGRQVRGGSRNLYKVSREGDFEKVMFMLIDGLDPNLPQEDGKEKKLALLGAVESKNMAVLHLLVEAGANVNGTDGDLQTILMEAVLRKNLDMVHYLVKAGANVNAKRGDGMTALHLAAQNGIDELVEFFLRKCAVDPNVQDEGGWTAIVWAAEHGHDETARLLLKLGANPNVQDNEENTALHWSAFSGSQDIASLLLDWGCDVEAMNDKGDRPIHIAARQDHYDCVVLFLSRGAAINPMNNNNETPLACARGDQNSLVWMALRVNSQLKSASICSDKKVEKMVHRDISLGRENQAISAMNAIDDQPAPLDFLYITESVETTSLPINRTVTSLQNCGCAEDCTTLSCLCARNSLRCWYDKEGKLTKDFNYTEPPLLFECNRGCRCWKTCSNRVVQHGQTARIQIYKTKGRGWGVRASLDIPQGSFICEYVGELITDSEADNREDDSYLFDLDNKDGDTYCIDARRYGNVARFINHRCEPNIIPIKVFVDHQDLRFPRICFFASTDIKTGEELGFDYGEKFWIIKYKDFLCACGSPKCKYSKAMIHQTLANYNRSLQEEN